MVSKEDTNIQTLVNVEYEVRKVLENLIKNNNQIILIYPIPTRRLERSKFIFL